MKGFRILIADDDPTQHEVLGEYLELAGFVVVHAYDGPAALDAMNRQPADLVCLDLRMPGMDGFEVLQELRARHPNVPVLFISSVATSRAKIRGLELGADDYIPKPFERAEVLARVRAALRRSQRFREALGIVSGDLREWNVLLILQALEMGRKSARLELPGRDAHVVVSEGRFVSAKFGPLTDQPALQRLCLLTEGPFEIHTQPPHDIQGRDIQAVIMEALVAQDEALMELEGLGGLDTMVKVIGSADGLPDVGRTATVRELLLDLPGDLRDAAARIRSAWTAGHLERTTVSK